MSTTAFDDLATRWLDEAQTLRRRGAKAQAVVLESCAEDLESAMRDSDLKALTLTQAAYECGYSADHLRRLIRDGKLTNVGRRNAPRVRRGDLPRKTRQFDRIHETVEFEVTGKEQIARSIVAEGGSR